MQWKKVTIKCFLPPLHTCSPSLSLYIYICLSISLTQRLPRNLFTAGRIQNNWIDQSHRSFDRLPRRRRLRRCRRRRRRSSIVVVVCEDDQIKKSQRDLVQKVKKRRKEKYLENVRVNERKKVGKFETQSKKKSKIAKAKYKVKQKRRKKKNRVSCGISYPVFNGRSAPI